MSAIALAASAFPPQTRLGYRTGDQWEPAIAADSRGHVYVGFNHEEKLFVASSHDGGQTFSRLAVNPNAERGSSLAGGATVDPAGNIYFGWTAYARHDMEKSSVNIYVSRSADGGRTWTTALLDRSSAPPGCEGEGCQTGYLGPQIALASDSAGALYALWNGGVVNVGASPIDVAS